MKKRKKLSKVQAMPDEQPENENEEDQMDPRQESSGIKKPKSKKERAKEQDLDELSSEMDTNLRIAVQVQAPWMDVAKEDIDFCLGEQWLESEKNDLKNAKRPVLTFNKIKPMVQLVTGHLIQTKARIQAFPEGGEDEKFTSVMDKVIDHIEKVSHLSFKLSYLFAGGERAGQSWIEFYQDYNDDPIFGQLKIPNLGPFKVFMDPTGSEYDLSDYGWGFKVVRITKARLKQMYPDKAKDIDREADDSLATIITNCQNVASGDQSDYGNSPVVPRGGQNTGQPEELTGDQREVTVAEYWKKDYVDKWFVYFVSDGAIEDFDTEQEALAEIRRRQKAEHAKVVKEVMAPHIQKQQDLIKHAAIRGDKPAILPKPTLPKVNEIDIEHAIRKRKVVKMKLAVRVGPLHLTDGLVDSPFEPLYSGFSWFRYISEWAPEADKPELKIQGMVRSLKDPQREKNKARSQYLHILNTSANSGWIGDEDALTTQKWDELRDFGAVPGLTIQKKKGTTLDRIHPVEPSQANMIREKAASDDFKEVSGLNSDLLSMDPSANPSGKAITLRIRQAITILQPSMENFRYTKLLIGQFLFSIIPSMFDAAKLEKVVGPKFMKENALDRGQLQAYLTMIHDGKYHVEISEAGAPDTLREETFEDMMQLIQGGMQLPPDLVIEFMNMPNKQEVMNRVKEYQQQQQAAAAQLKGAGKGR